MTLHPDDPGRHRRIDDNGTERRGQREVPGDRPQSPATSPPDRNEPAETAWTTEPPWVLPSIVLGLVALTGSLLLFVLAAIAGLALWALTAPRGDPPGQGRDPFGGRFGGGRHRALTVARPLTGP
ncbi:MAG TPA: hypothetical protein VFE39_03825 [Pseudonocardia sp.]|nr:hypothetical protein [Pseudonocardia sp.]